MGKTIYWGLGILAIIIILGVVVSQKDKTKQPVSEFAIPEEVMMKMEQQEEPTVDTGVVPVQTAVEQIEEVTYNFSGPLADVTDGKTIQGINTGGNAAGLAQASTADGAYLLGVAMSNLPDPQGTDFYEGWIVRKQPFDVISTGRISKANGDYVNTYGSTADLSDHDLYVLTIEPDDGDPAPADHILEGTLLEI